MISLISLHLKNFQTHDDTFINFSPNFNCIIGPTRVGKSSIVRALNFLFYNEWDEGYVRFGKSHCEITAVLSSGVVILREKGLGINKITVTTSEGVQRYESFGFHLPEEVKTLLGVFPIVFDEKDPIFANVAQQDDQQFLLHFRGPDKTRVLSRLSGLHWIDFALKDLNRDRRTKSDEITSLESSNGLLRADISKFKDLPGLKEDLHRVRSRLTSIKKVDALRSKVENLINKTSKWKEEYAAVQKLKSINFVSEIATLEKCLASLESLHRLQDVKRKLQINESNVCNIHKHLSQIASERLEIEIKIQEEIKSNPGCPICGSTISSSNIMEHV